MGKTNRFMTTDKRNTYQARRKSKRTKTLTLRKFTSQDGQERIQDK